VLIEARCLLSTSLTFIVYNAWTPEIPPLDSLGGWDGYFGLIVVH